MGQKFDGVVESVRCCGDGHISLVRMYERRGTTFSDYVVVSREELIEKLRNGWRIVVGKRVPYQASTFEVSSYIHLQEDYGIETLMYTDRDPSEGECLTGVDFF